MFKSSNKRKNENARNGNNSKKMSSAPSNALNSLVQGTKVEGEIESENDIRIDGVVKGKLKCNAKIIIGPSGYVEGEVTCKNAIIEGRLEGTMHVEELLNVRETAEVNGDIFTNKLIVQSGAIFNVGCQMGGQSSSNKTVETPKVVKSNAERETKAKKAS